MRWIFRDERVGNCFGSYLPGGKEIAVLSDRDGVSTGETERKRRSRKRGGSGRRRNNRGPRRGSQAYKKKVEERLFGKRDAGRGRMVERLRQAQGTPNFTRIYREYVKGHGMPDDLPTLILMLDVPDEREAMRVINAIEEVAFEAPSEQKSLLKSRLKNLEMSTSSDSLADSAADLLDRL